MPNSARLSGSPTGTLLLIEETHMRHFQFCPNGIVFFLPATRGESGLMDTIFCPLSPEEMSLLRDMGTFWLTRQNGGNRDYILGHQARNVRVTALRSRLYPDWTKKELFNLYREFYFSVEEHELPLKGR